MKNRELQNLRRLAAAHGIQLSYRTMDARRKQISGPTLAAVLKCLGVPAESSADVRDSLAAQAKAAWERCVPAAVVAWDGRPVRLPVHILAGQEHKPAQCELRLESGEVRTLTVPLPDIRTVQTGEVAGKRYVAKQMMLPAVPIGYHELTFAVGNFFCRTLLIAAPTESYSEPNHKPAWGTFLPMYAARSKTDWGAGNFATWGKLVDWVAGNGARVVACLPLLASFLEHPVCEPSPYSPASRLFWNDFYVDLASEVEQCPTARKLAASIAFREKISKFRNSEMIDYRDQASERGKILDVLATCFFSKPSSRRKQFDQFMHNRPDLEDYAAFRATCDGTKKGWSRWPQRMRGGELRRTDYSASAQRMHKFTQWMAQQQIDKLLAHCARKKTQFYLDLPLGVHPDGYDVWRHRDNFALLANAGAPPDTFFTKGQDWGFSPLHPQHLRENGYEYMLRFLRFQMKHTGLLRIDHVMGLHRLYWIPHGLPASEGAYVSYPAAEWHALLSLESHRNKTVLVGENLGTVPPEVDECMERHHLRQTYVLQYELKPSAKKAMRCPPALSVASLNTHDMPTFMAFCAGQDILDRFDLGLIPKSKIATEQKRRRSLVSSLRSFLGKAGYLKRGAEGIEALFQGATLWLGATSSEVVLVNLEDVWLETLAQNVPGTYRERPNWRRKARLTIENIGSLTTARTFFRELSKVRNRRAESGSRRPAAQKRGKR